MSKEAYYEMCEALGSEPIESEIPIDMNDFPEEVKLCFDIYAILKDNWDPIGGNYLGKDYTLLFELFRLYEVTEPVEQLFALSTMQHIDTVKSSLIAAKRNAKSPPTT